MPAIYYKSDYKHQLTEDYVITIPIKPKNLIITPFIVLAVNGTLRVRAGYSWDGCSGIIDTHCNLRASLVHDALYQLMRQKYLISRTHRKAADRIFKEICVEDGVSGIRSTIYYKVLRRLGGAAANPKNRKEVKQSPEEN